MKSIIFTALLMDIPRESKGTPLQYSCLENPMDGGAWRASVHGVAKSRTWLSGFTFTFHFRAMEKEMATHSSVLAWRIPGTGEPGGLPSAGSHRVGHDWSDLAGAVTDFPRWNWLSLLNCECVGVKSTMISSRVWRHCIDSCWGECSFPHHCFHSISVTVKTVKKVSNILQLLGEEFWPCRPS